MSARPVPATPTWNLLVTSHEGLREELLGALRPQVRFRRGGFPNVLVATVADPHEFLDVLRDASASSGTVRAALAKALPIDRTVRFPDPSTFLDAITATLSPLCDRLAGKTFFVRLHRRGFRGLIDSTRIEGEIGAWLVETLRTRGHDPHVRFQDPDVIVAIETLRDEAGIALLPRELREKHPFTRVR